MEPSILPCMGALRISHVHLELKVLKPVRVAECAIHFWQKGLRAGYMIEGVSYMEFPDLSNSHHKIMNIAGNIQQISVYEVAYWRDYMVNCRRKKLRSEQESEALIKDVVRKF